MSSAYSRDIHAVKLCQISGASYARYFGSYFICPCLTTAYLGVMVYFHVEKSSVAPCPVVATFWYGFLSFRSTEIVQLVSVLSGAGEDIPDTTILLSTGTADL